MKRRFAPTARIAITALAASAWLAASNHCALAGCLPQAEITVSGHEHCGGHTKPAEKESQPVVECCKTLMATTSGLTKSLAGFDKYDFAPVKFVAEFLAGPAIQHSAVRSEFDTGPPGLISFAELVLQHSVLAHAPPLFA